VTANATVDATRPHRKRMIEKHLEKRSGEANVDSRLRFSCKKIERRQHKTQLDGDNCSVATGSDLRYVFQLQV